MKKIGVTGGIGSGKTYITNILKKLGFPVFNSDKQAKICMRENKDVIHLIKNKFGEKIYKNDLLQRHTLASIVFNDSKMLDCLNSIVHPYVKKAFFDWCYHKKSKIVFKETAILFETNSNMELDYVISVSCPKKIRLERVLKRDGLSSNEILLRMKNQLDFNALEKMSDFIILNDGNKLIVPQIMKILNEIDR